jgi:HAD superfamily hydrolase (TIGR01509 family)
MTARITPTAILFDLDGTLVDTITLYGEAVLASLKERGIDATWDEYREWYNRPVHLPEVLERRGLAAELVTPLRARRDELYLELLKTKTQWYPGAKELLTTLTAKKIPLGMITGSWMSYVDAIDSLLDVKKYFDAIITVDDMRPFLKPHPRGLLLAAERMGVDPKDCVYIGDQRFDSEAATAAGMQGILVHAEWTPKDLSVEKEVRSVTELSGMLGH